MPNFFRDLLTKLSEGMAEPLLPEEDGEVWPGLRVPPSLAAEADRLMLSMDNMLMTLIAAQTAFLKDQMTAEELVSELKRGRQAHVAAVQDFLDAALRLPPDRHD